MDWSNLGEVTDWSDLSKMMEGDAGGNSAPGPKPNKVQESRPNNNRAKQNPPKGSQDSKSESNKGRGQQGFQDKAKSSQQQENKLENLEIDGWTDMKQFDDDHDPDWFEEEENRLAQIYGGHFIKVKYTEQGKPGYFCELCVSEMNAKKSLESHCEGMKHLKKKALWEKNNKSDGDADSHRSEGCPGGWSDQGPPRGRGGGKQRDRSPLRRSSPPPRRGPDMNNDARRPDYDRPRGRQGFGFSRDNANGRFDGPPDNFQGPTDHFRGPPDHFRGPPDQAQGPLDQLRRSLDQSRGPPNQFRGPQGNNGPPPDDRWGGRDERSSLPAPAPPPKEKLGGGTTGMLLTKLASCYIKDEEDADLALSVVSSLASSLREYNTKKGEKKIAELLMEAELKLNTLKALKVGLKLLGNKQTPGSTAAAAAAASRPQQYAKPSVPSHGPAYMNPSPASAQQQFTPYPHSANATPGYQHYGALPPAMAGRHPAPGAPVAYGQPSSTSGYPPHGTPQMTYNR